MTEMLQLKKSAVLVGRSVERARKLLIWEGVVNLLGSCAYALALHRRAQGVGKNV